MSKQSIKNWYIEDRPSKKLLLKGTDHLSNSELLSILLFNGTPEKTAVDLAKEILYSVSNDLRKLASLSVKELANKNIKGVGIAKVVRIAAALELGIRREMSFTKKELVLTSRDIADYLRAKLQYKNHEVFLVVFLNRANKVFAVVGVLHQPLRRCVCKKVID